MSRKLFNVMTLGLSVACLMTIVSATIAAPPPNDNCSTPTAISSAYTPGFVDSGVRQSGYYDAGPSGNTADVEVRVPEGAEVWFDDYKTATTGTTRVFSTPELTPADKTFRYEVKARWMENGEPVERTRTAEVKAGQRTTVDFTSK